tara:strand:- start:1441 stop:2106 length:666 start_codon:yes stop_codon:yes gene_type:complete
MKKIIPIIFFLVVSPMTMAERYISVGSSKTTTGAVLGDSFDGLSSLFVELIAEDGLQGDVDWGGDKGFSLSYGYKPSFGIGWQVSYIDGGGLSADATAFSSTGVAEIDVALEFRTFELALTINESLNDYVSIYGLVGLHRWDTDIYVSNSHSDTFSFLSTSVSDIATDLTFGDNGFDFTYGFGLAYEFDEKLSAGLQWQSFSLDGDNDCIYNFSGKLSLKL